MLIPIRPLHSVTCHVGAKVVMVDTAPDSFEMDYDKLAKAITPNTKVVIPGGSWRGYV